MKKYCLDLRVVSSQRLTAHHVLLKLTHDDVLPPMLPGQFVEVRVDHSPSTFLRRPISINYVDVKRNELWLLIAGIGAGTRRLCLLCEGDSVNCLLPLGHGFSQSPSLPDGSKVLLVGGGVGVAPLLWQGIKLREGGHEPSFLLGARSAGDLLELNHFQQVGAVYLTTEDDTVGEKGFVTNHSILRRQRFDLIQTCGPKPMMMAVASYARERGIDCEASLENLMACGLGVCLCCVEKTTEGNLRVCEDGPVFNTRRLLW
ncbi:dihydroorotate dehydrogenase electron transfer subunit [Hallella multisaccharivorax]|uniref:dihydroorotate dehydrogenase electron transfer subunit n=1 Tax=Hallella multisaccharivorax TaxID=310514 RepID=UPI0036184952